ncbi:MAG: PRC-barrel domain-containing protein [Ilumatobacter sp.]|uniref:PRC-barrel domain-containing protein n=1 Tax=Ilumatobacter sp. TaxID=1967498 RepID=UPI002607A1CD|nr:PRC-barrel domain-containing protein [Ilumatobacter sp.]MDJ0767839.1 PRC-barrel domain-containing protein [Ilumatobacter sp.]
MSSSSEERSTPTYTGHGVIDEHGVPVGAVTDVVYDKTGSRPEFLVVDPGIFRAAHYVPVEGAYHTNDGQIVVPWNKQWIKHSPKASKDHLLTPIDRTDLHVHYAGV